MPRGFGFVTFREKQAIDNVFQDDIHQVDGKTVECKIAVPKDQ